MATAAQRERVQNIGGVTREFYPKPSAYNGNVQESMARESSRGSRTQISPVAQAQISNESFKVETKARAGNQLTQSEYNLALSQANRPESGFTKTKDGLSITTMQSTQTYAAADYPGREQLLANVPMIAGGLKDTSGTKIASYPYIVYPTGIAKVYADAEQFGREKITYPIGNFIYSKTGITIEKTGEIFKSYQAFQLAPQSIVSQKLFGKDIYAPSIQLGGEFVKSYISEYKEKPVKQALFFTAGTALGFGLKAVNVGAIYGGAKIGNVFGGIPGAVKGASIARAGVQGITIGAGLGLTGVYTYNVGSKLINAKSAGERGTILGKEGAMWTSIGIGSYVGIKSSDIAIGYLRTRGKEYIPYENIVDPSRLKYEKGLSGGQKYPKIGRGETAGQLLKEFQPQLPGETQPASWTAAPTSFMKQTIIQPGSSELPAGYGAPKLNPQFFGSEDIGLFGFNIPSGMKTAIRGTPEGGFALFPGVKSGQRSFIKLTPEQFLAEAKPGVSYITFIKGEKEALTVSGTYAEQTAVRYYSKTPGLLGFRFPAQEVSYKIIGGTSASSNTIKAITSSYSGIGGNYIYNPASLGLSYLSISKPSPSANYYSTSKPSGYSISSYNTITSSITSSPISPPRSSPRGSRSSTPSYLSSPISYPSYPVSPSYSIPRYSAPTSRKSYVYIPPYMPSFELGGKTTGTRKRKKQPKKYQPSLRALFQGIKAPSIPRMSIAGIGLNPIISRRRK